MITNYTIDVPVLVGISGSLIIGTIRLDKDNDPFCSFCMNSEVVAM